MRVCELVYNTFWVFLGATICVLSVNLTLWDPSGPGNGFIPFLAGLFIAGSGLAMLLCEYARRSSPRGNERFLPDRPATIRILLILAGLCFIAATLSTLGFIISGFLTLCFLLRAVEPQKWWIVVIISLLSCACGYGLFHSLLQVPLPRGPFGL